jgi:hypothetical protein
MISIALVSSIPAPKRSRLQTLSSGVSVTLMASGFSLPWWRVMKSAAGLR